MQAVPSPIADRYEILGAFETGGSSASTLRVRSADGRLAVMKYSEWEGIGANGSPWLRAQADRLVELKTVLPPAGAAAIPVVYERCAVGSLYYYTMEHLEGTPLSIYHFQDS